MKPLRLPPARLGLADIAILCLLGGVIAVVVSFAREFEAPFSQALRIDLRPAALPWYTLYSLSRGVLALLISYAVFCLKKKKHSCDQSRRARRRDPRRAGSSEPVRASCRPSSTSSPRFPVWTGFPN